MNEDDLENNLSDDDNAAPDMDADAVGAAGGKEDPLELAMDDLEGRVVSAIDDLKTAETSNIDDLLLLLRPVVDVAAHTAPSIARTYYRGEAEGLENICEEVYHWIVSDLVLPVLLEHSQSEPELEKRAASLAALNLLWKEVHKAGSWLDRSTNGAHVGPYGPGGGSSSSSASKAAAGSAAPGTIRLQTKRRQRARMTREMEILRYWAQAGISVCSISSGGDSYSAESVGVATARGVLCASAFVRPAFRHVAACIRDTDDKGANRIFTPLIKLVESVLKKLFLNEASVATEALQAGCIKFIEILCMCCSSKPQDPAQRRRGHTVDNFTLEDLPDGHPTITREMLESIAEYILLALRGLVVLGGQVKMDVNLLSDMMLVTNDDGSPSAVLTSILKPAALAYLEIEQTFPTYTEENTKEELPKFEVDRGNLEYKLGHIHFRAFPLGLRPSVRLELKF